MSFDIANSSSVTLRNGVEMPLVGLGTSHQGGFSHEAILHALRLGYRLVDTAQRYGCEERLGLAIQESKLSRGELFLTDKVWPGNYGSDCCLKSVEESLAHLGTEYLDLLLLHWPGARQDEIECAWRTLELLYEQGKVRAIGVSNFLERHLDRLLSFASITPHVNQVEFHPYQNDSKLLEYCQEAGIQVEGYSPLGKGLVLQDPIVKEIASSLQVTPAQVLVRWSLQQGVVTIPKSVKKERVEENWKVWDFQLSEKQMKALGGLHRGTRVTWDPDQVP